MHYPTVTTHVRLVHRRHAGFSFAEVMFAVMLLGLGFIMVAAIFPVAIRQQQASMEDTTGVAVAKQGQAIMDQLGVAMSNYHNISATPPALPTYAYNLTQDGKLHSFFESVGGFVPYTKVKGDLIQPADRRFAWIPVAYRCDTPVGGMPVDRADVYLLAVQVRDKDQFLASDRDGTTFQPKTCYFYLTEGDTSPDTITFTNSGGSLTAYDDPNACEGAYVWVVDDQVSGGNGRANGRYYRLGAKVDVGTWQLQSGYDMPVTIDPGPDKQWGTADDVRNSQNLPPRAIGQPASGGSPAIGFIVGHTTGSGLAMDLFALPAMSVSLKP